MEGSSPHHRTTKEKIQQNQQFWTELLTATTHKKEVTTPEKKTYATAEKIAFKKKETLYKERSRIIEKETREKLTTILEQIQEIAKTNPLSKQTTQAFESPILNPGMYHINFFEHILTTVKDTTLESEKSRTWQLVVKEKHKKSKSHRATPRIN